MVEQVAVLANELKLAAKGVAAVVALLADKNTVLFIARYRKEATGGLDEVQIRAIEERRAYLSELEYRRAAIAVSIEEQASARPSCERTSTPARPRPSSRICTCRTNVSDAPAE